MQCSICEKMFAATLSVCPSCGAMQTQHNQAESSLRLLSIEKITTSDLALEIGDSGSLQEFAAAASENDSYGNLEQQIKRGQTTTLLEFPAKKSKDQEWRDEIKNRIRQRKENDLSAVINGRTTATAGSDGAGKKSLKSLSSAAESSLVINLKPKLAEKQNPKSKDLVAEALKRIERSRQKFETDEFVHAEMSKDASLKLAENEQKKTSEAANTNLTLVPSRKILPVLAEDEDLKNHVAAPSAVKSERKSVFTVPLNVPSGSAGSKPKTESLRESQDLLGDLEDTAAIEASLKSVRKVSAGQALLEYQELAERIPSTTAVAPNSRRQSNDDYAPLAQRFVAGAIDCGLCAAALLTLLYFAFETTLTTNWILTATLFAGTLFLYLTTALLFAGTTVGLRLFGMFVVTAENGEVPSITQTIIGSAVYLLTLATGGAGLLTVFFSSEQRALHDLLSGTVVIKE